MNADTTVRASCRLPFLLAMLVWTASGSHVIAAEPCLPSSAVLDRLWIWTHPAGVHDGIDLGSGRQGKSRMTPVEGAAYLGVSNVYFIHFPNNPPAAQFGKYAVDFRPMKRVVWSLTGAGGDTSSEGREEVLRLARQFPNITGFVLDDFLHYSADATPDPWLAANNARFPVSLVIEAPSAVAVAKIALAQTSWHSGDYRSKDFAVDLSADGRSWTEARRGILPNAAGATVEVELPGSKIRAVRVRILGTHDTQAARSCGLARVRLWDAAGPVALDAWKASATSTYSDTFGAVNVLAADRPRAETAGKTAGPPVPASMTPEQLKTLRARTLIDGRRLPITCVVYTHQISPRILPHVDQVDKVAMWTWRSDDLLSLEENFEKLRKLVHPKPILLGCYLFDYGDNKPMTVPRMKRQCELGLRWLREGKIEGMIFLASNVCDMDLAAVEWTRKWIASVARPSPPSER
jgi:hypothetical protein